MMGMILQPEIQRNPYKVIYNGLEEVVLARNEAHAGKLFKKLHNITECACKFRIIQLKQHDDNR